MFVLKKRNPDIFHFTKGSKFIYDFNESDSIIFKLSNLNKLKLTKDELIFLSDTIKSISSIISEKTSQFIYIDKNIFDSISKFYIKNVKRSEIENFIINKISNTNDRSKITCRNIAESYTQETGKIIHKTQVNNIMRNKLGLHYIKTNIKTKKILNKKNLLFQDESSILYSNNNFHCWRYKNEQIFFGDGKKNRKNLLLLVGEEIIYYSINNENTNEKNFLQFMNECLNYLKIKNYQDYIIIMDNYSVHKTRKLIEFYKENKVNILFNCPYASYFNSAELAFRSIKKKLYKKLFNDINDVEIEVKEILSNNNFNNTLIKNYRETLEQYMKFCEDNKGIIFNEDDVNEN